jgi:hypothetical protein
MALTTIDFRDQKKSPEPKDSGLPNIAQCVYVSYLAFQNAEA